MIQEDRAHFIRDFAKPALYDEPLRMALLEGRLPARELRKADPKSLYHCRIEGPVMPTIDPVKDRAAAQIDQEMGWESRKGNVRRFGHDPDQVDAEIAQDDWRPAAPPTAPVTEADEEETEEETDE
jgi:capsid protein